MRVTLVVLLVLSAPAVAAPRPVTVFLDREGMTVTRDDGDEVDIPAFGGSDRVWAATVACVRKEFAPFQVEITEQRPARGDYITALVGGRASLMGLDDSTTDGVGPYTGKVVRNAVVHVFSRIAGERNVAALCAVTAHEVGHSLGLDHEYKCGDLMSYFNDQCGTQHFLDVTVRCGEGRKRSCGNGDATQNSYQRLARLVGLKEDDAPARREPDPIPDVDDTDDDGGQTAAADSDDTAGTAEPAPPAADPWDGRAVTPDDNLVNPPDNRVAPDDDTVIPDADRGDDASEDASDPNDGYVAPRVRPDPRVRAGRGRARPPRAGRRRRAVEDSPTEDAAGSNRSGCGKRWRRAR